VDVILKVLDEKKIDAASKAEFLAILLALKEMIIGQ